MAAPLLPFPITGIVKNIDGIVLVSLQVELTNTTQSSNILLVTTDSDGRYDADAGNFDTGYVIGDTVSVFAKSIFNDREKTETFTISGNDKIQDITLEVIKILPEGTVGRTHKTTLVNSAGNPYQNTNPLPVELVTQEQKRLHSHTVEGEVSLLVTPGPADIEVVHIDAEDVDTETAFMLIDLSDTTKFPHEDTGHIDLVFLTIQLDPDVNYAGDVELGFLTNVDGTNGDFNGILEVHLDKKTAPLVVTLPLPFGGMSLETSHWFGPTTANSTLFQTDTNLKGPDGTTTFPSGDGDLVMIVGNTAGEVSVGVTVGYLTK